MSLPSVVVSDTAIKVFATIPTRSARSCFRAPVLSKARYDG
ncbi:hypothetical protein GGD65_006371 [Bradyrhizobium sp. CIR18]|nr:hypothetical protein [Bradyrhizobium sp. CIR18]